MRPEQELLLCAARVRLSPENTIRMRALVSNGLDSEYLLAAALRHGVMPLLYWHLNATCREVAPESTLDLLRDRFYKNAAKNLFLAAKLIELLRIFQDNGVSAVPYKGPVLAASLYGSLALRDFGDLDILVHKSDVLKCRDLLISSGYQPEYQLSPAQEAAYLRSECEYNFDSDDHGTHVEIHWEAVPRQFSFRLDQELLWKRIQQESLCGIPVPMLSHEDSLQILCVHGAKHAWDRLIWICDIAELLGRHQDLDWDRIIQRANTHGVRRMLLLGLHLANDLLGAGLPEGLIPRVRADGTIRSLTAHVRGRLFNDTPTTPESLKWQTRRFQLKARERLRDRLRYCLRLAHLKLFASPVG